MGNCKICGKESNLISSYIGVCSDCVLDLKEEKILEILKQVHIKSRIKFGLPIEIPKDEGGLQCNGCGNECKISRNKKGFCGLVENKNGQLIRLAGDAKRGLCNWYFDSLPTNCVAAWVCPARFELGFYNLSVFYGTCNFNCLFCQNWHFRSNLKNLSPTISAKDLASKAGEGVRCVCYFGGDPGPQIIHAIKASELAVKNAKGRTLRICMETNGNSNPALLERFAKIAFKSDGIIKFDLKTFDENLNLALCGISNKTTQKNFKALVKYHKERFKSGGESETPFLHVSTLLVPGYVEVEQVKKIADFVANLDQSIPYSLLAFHPTFFMDDLPLVSKSTAEECLKIAKEQGLERVRIGNVHLLR